MPRTIPLPRQRELMAAPELAALTLLEAAANVATVALAASHPDLEDASDLSDDPQLFCALAILKASAQLTASIHRYALALELATERELLLPF